MDKGHCQTQDNAKEKQHKLGGHQPCHADGDATEGNGCQHPATAVMLIRKKSHKGLQ